VEAVMVERDELEKLSRAELLQLAANCCAEITRFNVLCAQRQVAFAELSTLQNKESAVWDEQDEASAALNTLIGKRFSLKRWDKARAARDAADSKWRHLRTRVKAARARYERLNDACESERQREMLLC
jgi:hypothetical protein